MLPTTHAQTDQLSHGRSKQVLVEVVRDARTGLWRVAWPDGQFSGLANLARCRDAARLWARPSADRASKIECRAAFEIVEQFFVASLVWLEILAPLPLRPAPPRRTRSPASPVSTGKGATAGSAPASASWRERDARDMPPEYPTRGARQRSHETPKVATRALMTAEICRTRCGSRPRSRCDRQGVARRGTSRPRERLS